MPWIEASLRGQKVFARAKADGSLDAPGGRVEIRYKPKDARAYRAAASNLVVAAGASLLPDDHCVEAAPATAPAASPSSSNSKRASASGGKAPTITASTWIAYTDGACSGNPGPCGLGVVLVRPGGAIHEAYEFLGTGTNNVAELTAIVRAIETIPADAPSIVVHTDSKYAIGVLSQGWKAKANQELIASAKKILATRPRVDFVYVPGHAGVPMNERADELAREAIRTRGQQGIDAQLTS